MTSYVYRCFDADDRLLYVGHTINVNRRMSHHRNNGKTLASAVLRVAMDRYEVVPYQDTRDGERAEAEAIRNEAPLLNLQLSGRPGWMQWHDVAEYVESRGIEIEMVGLARCANCNWLTAARHLGERQRCSGCLEHGDDWLDEAGVA